MSRKAQAVTLQRRIQSLLTRRQQIVCAHSWFDGMTHDDIAERYGMRRSRVTGMIGRARKSLLGAGINPPEPFRAGRVAVIVQPLSVAQPAESD